MLFTTDDGSGPETFGMKNFNSEKIVFLFLFLFFLIAVKKTRERSTMPYNDTCWLIF